jgi:serine/threonine protein kinase/Tol biopolymer transport system component
VSLNAGTRLGPYEIVAPLGAGGMGEVYRAKDTRLGREVAVKVLPQHLTANPEIRARFEREAKTISSLNHPHICTLHDIGREGDTDYLVMELVDGETLAQRLVKGTLPVADVLRIGAQIADALDRAHRAGVIHRDLKPGNVMLTKSGAKLMDFGLARATGLTGPPGSASMATMTHSPTMAAPLTAEGTILGTFQYMSPEQLEGVDADARSDLWALGCVLYEMATGKRVFEGRSQATLISAIMTTQPPPVSQIAPLSPPELDRLVSACLAKDPADRVQSAHDVKLQLQWAGEGGSRLGAAAISGSTPARSRRRSLLLALPLLVGVLGLAAIIFSVRELRPKPSAVLSVQVPVPPNLRLTSFWSDSAISPDGRWVVASGARDTGERRLWLWDLKTAALRDLPETEQGFYPSWAPDSRAFVHFRQNVDGLFRADAAGGPSTRLYDAVWGRGASWGSRDIIVFAPNATGPILSIAAGGGATTQVTELDESLGETGHRFPHFLPDGEHFLYASLPVGADGFPIYVGSLSSRDRKLVMHSDCAPIYAEPGYLVFVQDGKVTARRFDLKRLEPVGEKFTIAAAPPQSDFTAEPVATASRDQRLLFPAISLPFARLEWLDRAGASLGIVAIPDGHWSLGALSHDGRLASVANGRQLWQVDLERNVASRLSNDMVWPLATAWSPDGRRLAFDAMNRGRSGIILMNAGGSGAADSVRTLDAVFQEVADWAPDGQSLLVAVISRAGSSGGETSWDLWTVPLGGDAPTPYLATRSFERYARISPDGRWVLFEVFDHGLSNIFIDSYPIPGHRVPLATGTEGRSLWGRGGREILYVDEQNVLISVPLEFAGDDVRPGRPNRLFRLPDGTTEMDTHDGERFLVSSSIAAPSGTSLQLILGWTGLFSR